jgi:dTDP-4-dehydrorhamnose reductase
MKNVVVLGTKGMLGYAVSEYYGRRNYPVTKISRSEFDIAKDPIEKLEPMLKGKGFVINCAGVIKPMIAKTSIEDVLRVNVVFPRNLAKLCDKLGLRCYHVTTDCVYSGKRGDYTENDFFDAEDIYGMSKNGGDTAECMVLRTSIIGEENGQSRSLLEWARSNAGKDVNGFTNHRWNGVTTLYLAEIIETIESKNLYQKGIFHVYSPNTVNKFELLQQINDAYDLKLTVKAVEAGDRVDRNLSSVKNISSKVSVKEIKQQLKEMRKFFSEKS